MNSPEMTIDIAARVERLPASPVRAVILFLSVLMILPGLACTADRDVAAAPAVHIVANGAIPRSPVLPVRFQPLDEPELDRLATHEHLRDVIASEHRQFDQMLRLRDWVNAQWPDGTPNPYPPWNALTVLDWIRSGKTGGFCGQYSQVFLQSLAALGFTARYVEIGSRDNPYAHYVTEVWSNDFNKWVLMDADYNVHFERRGIPLSALEIHDALLTSTLTEIHPVLGEIRAGHATISSWPQQTAELYYYIRYHLKADHLTKPHEAPFDRLNDMIGFEDERVEPWETSPVPSQFTKERLTRRRTTDRAAVSAKLNQVWIDVRRSTPDAVVLELYDNVLQRASYEYRAVDTAGIPGPWQSFSGSTLTVPPPQHGGSLDIRGVNVRGVPGPISTVAMESAQNAH
jgi:hypothetical protein